MTGAPEDDGLLQLKEGVWVLPGPNNIGFVKDEEEFFLIDSGNDKEAGRRINKILKNRGWHLRGIVNTHSNADHIGGNAYLQRNLNVPVWAAPVERAFIEHPELEAAFLWGGYPVKELDSKFFRAKPSRVSGLVGEESHGKKNSADGVFGSVENRVGKNLSVLDLPGHFFGMTGFRTDDGVLFLGDALFGKEILEKYGLPFIYDVEAYKASIHRIMEMDADYFVPSHGSICRDIRQTGRANLDLIDETGEVLISLLGEPKSFEMILKLFCDRMGIQLNCGQYALIGSTLKSFLSFLYNSGRIGFDISDNTLSWRRI